MLQSRSENDDDITPSAVTCSYHLCLCFLLHWFVCIMSRATSLFVIKSYEKALAFNQLVNGIS